MKTQKTSQLGVMALLAILFAFTSAALAFAQEEAEVEVETEIETEIMINDVTPNHQKPTQHTAEGKNAVTLDAMALVKGFIASDTNTETLFFNISLGYERLLFAHFSVGAELYLTPGTFYEENFMFLGIAATGRYYLLSEYMDKFFLGAIVGFNMQFVDGKINAEDGGFAGMYAGLNAGYKFHFTKMFFVEPSLSYTYSKTDMDSYGMTPVNYGWQVSLRAGISF